MRSLSSLLFAVCVAMSVTGLAHYSVWAALVRDIDLPPALSLAFTLLLVCGWLSLPLTFWLSMRSAPGKGGSVVFLGYVWLGVLFLAFAAVAAGELARGLLGLSRVLFELPAQSRESELWYARVFSALIAVLVAILTAIALYQGSRPVSIREVRVTLLRLPRELDGIKILQLSDLHIGPSLGQAFVKHVVALTNGDQPDVIAITGDLVDGAVTELRHLIEPLAQLKARHGVYFVTGNHEYYSGADAWCSFLQELGLRVLRNERVSIGSGAASFDLAGIDDYSASHFGPGQGPDLAHALRGRDPSRELVLLAHQPRAIHEAERAGVGLQLSGHTHGGQIWPFGFLVKLQQPAVAGLRRIGNAFLYVSRGTGYWGPPMRLGAPSEITRLVLLSGPKSE